MEAVDGGNIGVVQRREELCLAFKASQAIRVIGERLWEHFDRHLAIEGSVGGRPHDAHPALAELVNEPVMEKSCILI